MGIVTLLKEKIENVTLIEAKNITEFREDNKLVKPGLFIAVINSDFEEEGTQTIYEVKTHYPQASLILFGEEMQPEIIIDYLKSGANGYLTKHKDLNEFITCINTVIKGKRYISPEHMEVLFDYLIDNYKTSKKQDLLTPRQNEIARLLMQGMTTSSIAEKTGLRMSTVSTFKNAIFVKLGIDNVMKLKEIMEADENNRPA